MSEYSEKAIEILEAAELRIRRGGFDAVSYRDLAADVGIRAASVHYHFPQKALLGAAVVDRYAGKIMAAIGPVDLATATAAEHLRRLCGQYEAAVRDQGLMCLGCVLGAESRDLPEPVVNAVRRFYTGLLDWLGLICGDEGLAVSAIGLLQGTMVLAVTLGRQELMDGVGDRLVGMVGE
jgi:TetR/AcrR family transcriptional regulator, transcriptional repressor for nem operon